MEIMKSIRLYIYNYSVSSKINIYNIYQHIMSYLEKPNIPLQFSLESTDNKILTRTFNEHIFLVSLNPCV